MCKALDELEKKSKAKGLAEGKAKGLAEGKAKGLAEGEAKGEAKGLIKGATAKAEQIASKMFADGFDLATVMEYTELPEGRLRALAEQAAR